MRQKSDVQVAAAEKGLSVAEFIHLLVVPEARRIVARSLEAPAPEEPPASTGPEQ
jgi:hypothetical protein